MNLNSEIWQPSSDDMSESEANGLTFLEQLTELASVDCDSEKVPWFFNVDEEQQIVRYAKGGCGMWSCESCGARNAIRWIARIIDGCNRLPVNGWYFATITAHRRWRGSKKSLENIRTNWHKLRKRMIRSANAQGEDAYYARVWEPHKDASFHMHLITNAPVTTRWLKDNSAQCGLGYQAKIDDLVNAGQAAGYVSKYMLKAMPNATHYPKGARRIEVSRNWVAWYDKKESDWHFLKNFDDARFHAEMYKLREYTVLDKILQIEQQKRDEKSES
ncbi:MAG: hypothetical protein AAFN11_03710 [Chloroflexota bacterium]